MEKICTKCECSKDIEQFPFRNKSKGIRHYICTECWKEIRKESYQRNKETTIKRNQRNKKRNKDWFKDYKLSLKCIKCGEDHPACLDFHHEDPNTKEIEVSSLVSDTVSLKKIMDEIDKCIVLCANCHRKYHYNKRQKEGDSL